MSQQVLLSTEQVAERLGLSKNTLIDWRWKRTGPPWTKIGSKCVRYIESAVESWIDQQTQNPMG